MRRDVHCADATEWLRQTLPADHAIVSSIPDVSELGITVDAWRTWFLDAAALTLNACHEESVALFFQTDARHEGYTLDKSALLTRAIDDVGAAVIFHKIVLNKPPGRVTFARASFSHFLCASKARRVPAEHVHIPDVIVDDTPRVWTRAMSTQACAHAVRFAQSLGAKVIVDPFCGKGTVLAVANALGLDAVGVERHRKRAEEARHLRISF